MMDIICDNVYCPLLVEMDSLAEEGIVKGVGQLSFISRLVKVDKGVWEAVAHRAQTLMQLKNVKQCTPSEGFGCMQFMLKECVKILESAPSNVILVSSLSSSSSS
jgi:hypothetical protein